MSYTLHYFCLLRTFDQEEEKKLPSKKNLEIAAFDKIGQVVDILVKKLLDEIYIEVSFKINIKK